MKLPKFTTLLAWAMVSLSSLIAGCGADDADAPSSAATETASFNVPRALSRANGVAYYAQLFVDGVQQGGNQSVSGSQVTFNVSGIAVGQRTIRIVFMGRFSGGDLPVATLEKALNIAAGNNTMPVRDSEFNVSADQDADGISNLQDADPWLSDDAIPDSFTFTATTGAELATAVSSSAVTISGMNAPAAISVSGGEYSINSGPFVSSVGTVKSGDKVQLRVTSASALNTAAVVTVTIGGVQRGFSVTTKLSATVVDTTPDAFSFGSETSAELNTLKISSPVTIAGITSAAVISIVGGEYSINSAPFTSNSLTINNGDSVRIRLTTSAQFSTAVTATLTVGGVQGQYSVTTKASGSSDTVPDAFSFSAQTGVDISTAIDSNGVTITGIDAPANIAISSGQYKINTGNFVSAPGTINPGDVVQVRVTSSALFNTSTSATLTIGGVQGVFTVTTKVADPTPDAFSFTAVPAAELNTLTTSNTITVSGINTSVAISVSGGEYSINGGGFTASSGTVNNGNAVQVRLTSSAQFSTQTSLTLTIGGVQGTFAVTTKDDTTPDAFSFNAVSNALTSTLVTSDAITVAGINAATAISISGGEYSINLGAFTSSAGAVVSGDSVRVRLTSNSAGSGTASATLTIGGVQGTFTVTTQNDTTPDAFSFTAVTGAELSTVTTSNSITVSGINTSAAISILGGEYSINSGAFTSASGSVTNGSTVRVRLTSSSENSTLRIASLNIGGEQNSFRVTTKDDTTPDAFSFTPVSNAEFSTVTTSNTITVSGVNAATAISITGGTYAVNGGGFTSSAGTVVNGNNVQVRVTSSSTASTSTSATLTIGGVQGVFSVTTKADTTPDAFSFTSVREVEPNVVTESNAITATGITGPSTVTISGGEYSIAGNAYTSEPGSVINGDAVRVRLTSTMRFGNSTNATLNIGGVSGQFAVTTRAANLAGYPDTGIIFGGNYPAGNNSGCTGETISQQDCSFGRDVNVATNSDADGHKGFSYARVCNSGEQAGTGSCPASPVLGAGNNDWGCTLDNVTGLLWEVKTDDNGLRDKDHAYTWFNSDAATNGGASGTASGGTCFTAGRCDIEKYAQDVNALSTKLCGFSDWRVPIKYELMTLVNYNATTAPLIDQGFFPNTVSFYWSSSPLASNSNLARYVNFGLGLVDSNSRASIGSVRLVRGGQ